MANDRQELEELRRIDELERKAAGGKTEAKKPSVSKEESGFGDSAKAFGKSLVEALPAAGGGFAGMEAGAALGSLAGPVGTLAGGLIGGIGGAYLGEKAGETAGEMIPEETKKEAGFGEQQRNKNVNKIHLHLLWEHLLLMLWLLAQALSEQPGTEQEK